MLQLMYSGIMSTYDHYIRHSMHSSIHPFIQLLLQFRVAGAYCSCYKASTEKNIQTYAPSQANMCVFVLRLEE